MSTIKEALMDKALEPHQQKENKAATMAQKDCDEFGISPKECIRNKKGNVNETI